MATDLGFYIKQHIPWNRLSPAVKESLGNTPSAYERAIIDYSVSNQLIWRSGMVRQIIKSEKKYYESVLQHCRANLLLYPYHLQDQFVQGLKVTPFEYYHSILELIMIEQRSYDSLPNFTARDCFRLIGIGRNEYIDIMNKYRSKRFWRKKSPTEFLPISPQEGVVIKPWWLINVGYVTEEEIERCTSEEHNTIDLIIKNGAQVAGKVDKDIITNLYNRQLIYTAIVIKDTDYIVVPPLKGFVMNRVSGDYFETLLYKVFVTINEHTQVSELANVLQIELQDVKNAISVFIRLGFAHLKVSPDDSDYHESWKLAEEEEGKGVTMEMELNEMTEIVMEDLMDLNPPQVEDSILMKSSNDHSSFQKRIGFVFDSTLTAFLMMGNLSPGLKNHAVTMFEVGKLTDEGMEDFLNELGRVGQEPEGEAQRYFQHAVILRDTLQFLRHNKQLAPELSGSGLGVDLLHCESMSKLDSGTLNRLLEKNYCVLLSMAPLSQEVHSISTCIPPHIGPAIPEMNSIWFKLWLYHILQCGPPSLLLTRGTRLRTLPEYFRKYKKLLLTSWGHDTAIISTSNVLMSLNEALTHSPILIQAHGWKGPGKVKYVSFPFQKSNTEDDIVNHHSLKKLETLMDVKHTCGYVTMLNTGRPLHYEDNRNVQREAERNMEISEFLQDLQDLGIGETNKRAEEVLVATATTPIKAHQEWVPLDMCYGVPLFSSEANQSVTAKIVANNLFSEDSLKRLTRSNRSLSLDLMDFITQFQDNSIYGHKSTTTDGLSVPMPTRSLLFYDNTLTTFNV